MTDRASARVGQLGGLTRRSGPEAGLRPTVLFALAGSLTVAWVVFAVWASGPWRGELEAALGPVMGWVIPILLAYIPALVIGFMLFTLLVNPYRELELVAPTGSWPAGRWPAVTLVLAARNEADAIVPTLERVAGLTYPGPIEVVLADNGSTDRTGELADDAAKRLGLDYRRVVVDFRVGVEEGVLRRPGHLDGIGGRADGFGVQWHVVCSSFDASFIAAISPSAAATRRSSRGRNSSTRRPRIR